jgi:hypothetical protein
MGLEPPGARGAGALASGACRAWEEQGCPWREKSAQATVAAGCWVGVRRRIRAGSKRNSENFHLVQNFKLIRICNGSKHISSCSKKFQLKYVLVQNEIRNNCSY